MQAELYKNWLIMWRNFFRLFDITLFPLSLFFAITLFLRFVSPTPEIIFMAVSGMIGWQAVYRLQVEAPLSYMDDYWSKNTSHLLASPIRVRELILSSYVSGLLKFLCVLAIFLGLAYSLFDFSIPSMTTFTIAVLYLCFTGALLGLFVFGIVVLYNHKAITFAFLIPDLLVLMSGVYYPISIFPDFMVTFVHILPTFYGFELLKSMVGLGTANYAGMIITGTAWLLLCIWFLRYAMRKAKKEGMLMNFN